MLKVVVESIFSFARRGVICRGYDVASIGHVLDEEAKAMPQPVIGESSTSQDPAVNGENTFDPKNENVRTMGSGYGVRGQTSAGYAGVYGEGGENGVFGFSKSHKGSGVFGRN